MNRSQAFDRDYFVVLMTRAAVLNNIPGSLHALARTCGQLCNAGRSLSRLHVAYSNGDPPARIEGHPSTHCGGSGPAGCGRTWVDDVLSRKNRVCPICRIEQRIRGLVRPFQPLRPIFQGDPRGHTLRIMANGIEIPVPTS